MLFMSKLQRHFRMYLFENWTDLDKTGTRMGNGKRVKPKKFWRDCSFAPEAPDKGAKYQPFSSPTFLVMNTMHPFGHLRFTCFSDTWQLYVNQSPQESFCSKIFR